MWVNFLENYKILVIFKKLEKSEYSWKKIKLWLRKLANCGNDVVFKNVFLDGWVEVIAVLRIAYINQK